MSEHQEQCALFEWAAIKSRNVAELEYLFAVPNGGFRHKATAARLKKEGLKRGVPDVALPVPRGGYHGLFGEMKFGRNKPTKDQDRWLGFLMEQGYCCLIWYTWAEAARDIMRYLRGHFERR